MKKIKSIKSIIPFAFILMLAFLEKPIYSEINNDRLKNNFLISGWRSEDSSYEDRKAGFKTLDALKKFKKVRRLKPYFRTKGYAVFPNVGKAGFGIGSKR